MGRGWKDIAYSTIPYDYRMQRIHWHFGRIWDTAREKAISITWLQAHTLAERTVEDEERGLPTLEFVLPEPVPPPPAAPARDLPAFPA